MITSIHNPKIKQFQQSIARRRTRRESGRMILEGVRLIEAALAGGFTPEQVLYSNVLNQRGQALLAGLENCECIEVESSILERVSETETSQGILASLPMFELAFPTEPNLLLLLDHLQDPGNAGTLLRSALGAGAQGVVFSEGSVDAFSPKVLRAGMGAHFHMPIQTLSVEEIERRFFDKIDIWQADATRGTPYWLVDYCQPLIIAIGSESSGITPQIQSLCKGSITIPTTDSVESLNAAIAGSIILYESRRQRFQ